MRDLVIPLGRVRLVAVPVDDVAEQTTLATLLDEEQAFARQLTPTRRREWIAGRHAMRTLALDEHGVSLPPILPNLRGAPQAGLGFSATLSHKHTQAAALVVARAEFTVGLDLEVDSATRTDVSHRVLTDGERTELLPLTAGELAHEVRRRFAMKEAIYKAMDPWLSRYVGFREVELSFVDGNYLARGLTTDVAGLLLTVDLRSCDGILIAWASARPR